MNNTSRLVVNSLELQFVLKYCVDTTTKYSFEKSINNSFWDYKEMLEIEEYHEILEQAKEIYQ